MPPCGERGRSLVEMLGTLAIMGILSITGISGFRMMMNKHHANTILEEAKMHSVLLAGRALNQGLPENTSLENISYPFTYKKESEVAYSLNLAGVDEGVCRILNAVGKLSFAETLLINAGADCQKENTLTFYINTEMTPEITNNDRVVPCEDDSACGECGTCGNQHVCVFTDSNCTDADKPYCNQGTCQRCPSGEFFNHFDGKNSCEPCDFDNESTYIWAEESECQSCPNRLYLPDGRCISCETKARILTSDVSLCSRCPNRYMTIGSTFCDLCEGKISSDYHSCLFYCAPGYVGTQNGCQPCDSPEQRLTLQGSDNDQAKKDCSVCSNRTFMAGRAEMGYKYCALNCAQEGEFLDADGYCRSCDSDSFYIGWDNHNPNFDIYNDLLAKCNACPNMIPDASNNKSCIHFNNPQPTVNIRPEHCKTYFKGKRYVAKDTWQFECTLCPEKDTEAWEALTAEQQAECTPAS
ncbi:MAG: Tfp pilus assembly protein FimT/FimU [Alphaproteobacteria bacterium]